MTIVYLGLGSNIEPQRHLKAAIAALRRHFGELGLSPVYESVAIGFEGDNFLNMVVALETDGEIDALQAILGRIEADNARDRSAPRFSSRTLDIDLLLWGDRIIEEGRLKLPRPEIYENAFVLRPLADLAPELRDPLSGRSFAELWREYDQSSQSLWPLHLEL